MPIGSFFVYEQLPLYNFFCGGIKIYFNKYLSLRYIYRSLIMKIKLLNLLIVILYNFYTFNFNFTSFSKDKYHFYTIYCF